MRALVLSGGGSKGAFTAGVTKYLLRDQGMEFDIAVGNSTRSLVGGPALLEGEHDYLSNIYVSVSDSDIFKNSFFGSLNFLGIQDGPIGASMDPLHDLLKDYYLTDGKLQELIDNDKLFSVAIRSSCWTI